MAETDHPADTIVVGYDRSGFLGTQVGQVGGQVQDKVYMGIGNDIMIILDAGCKTKGGCQNSKKKA
jgi:hypothetical protein